MAEAGQKDQTGNEAVAREDANLDSARPQSIDDFTGLSNASAPPETKPEVKQQQETTTVPKDETPAAPQDSQPAQPASSEPAQQPAPVKPAQPADSTKPPSSKFLENEWQQALLRHSWHMQDIDDEFSSILKGLQKNKDDSLTFETNNGKFLWGTMAQKNATGGVDQIEYIGLPGRFSRLTQELADDQMKAAKAHGWKAVNLHGSDANKEKMWLAAMRSGLEVSNFLPPEGSKVLEIWKKESAEITGLTNANNQPQEATPKAEEPKAAEPPKVEEPAAPAVAANEPPKVEEPKAAEPPKVEEPAAPAVAANEPPKADEPKAAEPPKAEEPAAPAVAANEPPKAEEPKAAEPPKVEEPAAPAVAANEPPKAEEPKAAEPPKAEEPAAPAVAANEPPKAEEPKAAEPPKVEEPAAPAVATNEPPKAEEPKAAEPPKAEEPKAEEPAKPAASKFGSVEPPKAEEPKAAEPPKANPAHAQWEKDKALFSSKPEGEMEVSREGRMNVEAVEGMSKRAASVQDPTHRAGIEKLQDAIKSGKVSVDGPIEREIINNVDSPKGFQKAAEYFGKKADSDLGLPKVDAPAAAENTAPTNKAPKNKGPA